MSTNLENNDISENFYVEEFSAANFGDERLLSRLIGVSAMLDSKFSAPLNQATGGSRGDVVGAYRFFNNDKVDCLEILDSHRLSLATRISELNRVFAIQDTVFFDYSDHFATENLGSIGKPSGKKHAKGVILHHSLVIDENKVPYGISSQQFWARTLEKTIPRKIKKQQIKKLSIEDKESSRWLTAMQETQDWIGSDSKEIIHLGDRECDIFEFLLKAQEQNFRYVIRSCFNRQTIDEVSIADIIKLAPVRDVVEIEVKKKGGCRTAKIELKYESIVLEPSKRAKSARSKMVDEYKPVTVWLVSAEEICDPKGVEKISWRLFTNIAVENTRQAIDTMNWYKLRWTIEDFHKVIKSGFKVEDCRLGTREALERFICLTSIVALKIMKLTFLSRKAPNSLCTNILTKDQCNALYFYIHKKKPGPGFTPTLGDAVLWIGRMGGYLGQTNDPPPGYVVLWRGWIKLQHITEMWVACENAPN